MGGCCRIQPHVQLTLQSFVLGRRLLYEVGHLAHRLRAVGEVDAVGPSARIQT